MNTITKYSMNNNVVATVKVAQEEASAKLESMAKELTYGQQLVMHDSKGKLAGSRHG